MGENNLLNSIQMAIYLRISYEYFLDMLLTEWSDMPVYDYETHPMLFDKRKVFEYLTKKYNN